MRRIISVSRRTDIPAFYGDWFMRRIQEGFAGVVAPYGGKRYLVSLAPQDVDCFVFWSKDFTPFVPHLETLDRLGYRFYFNYTLTAVPSVFETNVDKAAALKTLTYLSDRYSPRHINWRFDPIILSSITDEGFYLDAFERLAAQLAGRVERCYFSFVTEYEKVKRNLLPLLTDKGIQFLQPSIEEKIDLADRLAAIADRYGIRMYSCCGDYLLSDANPQGPLHRRRNSSSSCSSRRGWRTRRSPRARSAAAPRASTSGPTTPARTAASTATPTPTRPWPARAFHRHDPDSAFLGFDKSQSDTWVAEIRHAGPDGEAHGPALFP